MDGCCARLSRTFMSTVIKMYNAYFGDCFVIENNNSNLVVDYGTRSDSNPIYKSVDDVLDGIANDLDKYSEKQLLITHFHYDHISGLTKLYSDSRRMMFEKVYIPNIWNNSFAIASNLMEEAILSLLLKKSMTPDYTSGTISIFDLLIYLCGSARKIMLLKRGDIFENSQYITLLPDDIVINKIEARFGEDIPTLLSGLRNDIVLLSERISSFFTESEYLFENVYEYRSVLIDQLQKLRSDYDNILSNINSEFIDEETIEGVESYYLKLNKLNNKISLVFQNVISNDCNLLFTGDVDKSDLKRIAQKTDIPLHKHYKYIKVPHHGTESHYFDFKRYSPEWLLIPNGFTKKNDTISSNYGSDGLNKLCSNSNHCDNCSGSCKSSTSCNSLRNIVYPCICRMV